MISVQTAREHILASLTPPKITHCPLTQAAGRLLAESIHAQTDLPTFDNSSVDGFAVRASDVVAAPVSLPVVADIPAGQVAALTLQAGQAARIMTGAALPAGADAVVMVEETDFYHQAAGMKAPAQVVINKPVRAGENLRPRGMDIRRGQEILRAGRVLRAQDIGLLAMLGVATVPVWKKPKVALLSSGDELLPVEAPLEAGKIHDSNSYMLAAQVEQAGGEVLRLGVAQDYREQVQALLEQAVQAGADVIISSAGMSVGAYDFVREVVESAGTLTFWKVNMRPGKPVAFGTYRGIPFFGLPGNPVSCFVSFLVFARPALRRLGGFETDQASPVRVQLAEALESDGRESYLRAQVSHQNGLLVAHLTGHQGSGNLFSLVQANALLIIPSGVKSCPPGSEVEAWLLED